MRFIKHHSVWVIVVVVIIVLTWFWLGQRNGTTPTTALAEVGTVTSYISVSGTAEVEDIIPLSFPRGGTVSGVFVSRGDEVATGTILATVGDTALQAEYAAALAEVARTKAQRDELITGQTIEEAEVTATTLRNAESALTNTIRTEAARVEAARTTLYSTGLTAVATNPDTEAVLPRVSGSYTCTAQGTYTIEMYRSGTLSGYSYRYSGIETGVGNANTNQSAPLGNCGLRLQFDSDSRYADSVFTISIPNTANVSYATNQTLYDQALVQEEANINAARRALDIALNQATVATAGTRVERLIAANAVVAAAEARLAQISYTLSESALRTPKSGIVTDVHIVTGQTVAVNPAVTVFAPVKTTVTARIPEKDIARLAINQSAEMEFDASPGTIVTGIITFLSPVQTIVNGTPYYEAVILLDATPDWLRPGMQADVQIITDRLYDVVRIPRLFLQSGEVVVQRNSSFATTTPEVLLVGTDGFVAITGINAGEKVLLTE